jgi:MFS family permease
MPRGPCDGVDKPFERLQGERMTDATPAGVSTAADGEHERAADAGEPRSPRSARRSVPSASLWRHRDFMLLWSGQAVSEIGSAATQLALPLAALLLLDATTLQVSLLTAASTAAFAVVTLPAGAIVDRYAKRPLMVWCDAARLLLIGSVPLAAMAGLLTMAQLYVVAVTAGVCSIFFSVAYASYLPDLVSPGRLVDGNGKLGVTQAFAQVAGPGAGGGLVSVAGPSAALGVDALSHAVSMTTLLAIRAPATRPPRSASAARRGRLRTEIAEGLSFVVRHPVLRHVVACTATSNLFGGMVTAVQLVFLVRVLHVPTAQVGLIVAVAGVGGVLGGALIKPLTARIGSARIIWFSCLVLGLPMLVGALAAPGWRVALFVVALFASSFQGVVYSVAQLSYRQAVCPPELRGRVNAASRWIVWGTIPLGALIGGALGPVIGLHTTLWIAFVGDWAAGFLVYFSPLRHMRDFGVPGS